MFFWFHAHELKNAIHNRDGVIATSTSLPSTEKHALKSGIEGIRHSLNTFLKIYVSDENNQAFPVAQIGEYLEISHRGKLRVCLNDFLDKLQSIDNQLLKYISLFNG